MSIGNRTLKYLGISMQTLPEIQECLKVILDKKPKDYTYEELKDLLNATGDFSSKDIT